jgi:predicted NAD/FAD-binding protein
MTLEELDIFRKSTNKNIVDNVGNFPATQRTVGMGTHEELRKMQARMRDEQEVDYWLMNLIEPDYSKLVNKIRGRNVFFDASNIFSYHMSHAYHTLYDLVESYERLHEILSYAETCWFQGTRPTKQWERKWISFVYE